MILEKKENLGSNPQPILVLAFSFPQNSAVYRGLIVCA